MKWQALAKKLAVNIRKMRGEQDLTQEEASERSECLSLRHWQYLESGEKNCTLQTLASVAKALNVDIKDLFK